MGKNVKLFVWNEANAATDNYHSGGGIVAIAPTLERARELIGAEAPENCEALTKEPDLTRECAGPEYVAIHPDAGCC